MTDLIKLKDMLESGRIGRREFLKRATAVGIIPAISTPFLNGSALAADRIIKIGGAVPLSGPVAYWGISTMQGWVDGAAVINEAGGISINGEPHMLEVINYDTKGTVADSRAATTRLVEQDEVKYVFSQAAASTIGMLQITEPNEVLSVVACWGYLELFGKDYPFHFRAEMSDYEQGYAYMPFMNEHYGKENLKTASFIGPDDQDGYDCHFSYERLMKLLRCRNARGRVLQLGGYGLLSDRYQDIEEQPRIHCHQPVAAGHHGKHREGCPRDGLRGSDLFTGRLRDHDHSRSGWRICPQRRASRDLRGARHRRPRRKIRNRFIERFGDFNALGGNYSWWVYALAQAFQDAGTADDTKAVADALGEVVLEDTYVGKVTWEGENSFGIKRQGVYDCYTTLIENGQARLADVRYPELPADY